MPESHGRGPTAAEVFAAIGAYSPLQLPQSTARAAAVLIPLWQNQRGGLELILTRRSKDLSSHPGQVSFPGGAAEPGDLDVAQTALRETEEEIGIAPSSVQIIGRLDDVITISDFHVAQIVGVVGLDPQREFSVQVTPHSAEVDRVFSVPLSAVLSDRHWRSVGHSWQGTVYKVWHLDYDGEDIWGITGAMLRQLAELLWTECGVEGPD